MENLENAAKLSHKEWRKIAKKYRRKRIRQKKAQERDKLEAEEEARKLKDPTYLTWLAEQRALELFQEEEDELQRQESNRKWLECEKEAQKRFQELREKLDRIDRERAKEKTRIREEYKAEQERRKKLREEQKRIAEEKRLNHEKLMGKIELYVSGEGELPPELLETADTNPERATCPFFVKTGACRFGDQCSRNHSRPNIGTVVLIPNFFTHILLEQFRGTEYGTDMSLEYEEREMETDFKEFYYDVVSEFELFGTIKNFFVCKNTEPHLRGNVYIEYKSRREAMKVYQKFQGRFYGGKQLNVGFRSIESWSTAICGLSFVRKCPKGSQCSFLHIFRNPDAKYSYSWRRDKREQSRTDASEERRNGDKAENDSRSSWNDEDDRKKTNWRWSDSSESDSSDADKSSRSKSETRDRRYHKSRRVSQSRSSCDRKHRGHSRTRQRN